jgi:hypothetical protein
MSIACFVLGILSITGDVLGNLDLLGYGEKLFNKSPVSRCCAWGFGVVGIILSAGSMINAAVTGFPLFFTFTGLILSIIGTVIAFVLIIIRLIFLHSV